MATGLREGSLFGERYRLERMLGSGGMATVWLARDERLSRPVAVKILSDTLAADPSYVRRFRREARLAAGLSHPNLVQVYDFGGDDDRPYLVMEYVEGGSLADRISAGTATGLDVSRLARELLAALDHIHAAAIIHRDVKPGNVLLTPDGAAKLTDFGIAQPEDATRLTSTGLVIGTRSYIAPEVARGEQATVRSDLYSCGMVLREASGDSPPPAVAHLVTRLADENPERRPESASRALTLLAESVALQATTETAPTEPLARDRPAATIAVDRRLLAGVSVLAALVLVAIVLLAGGDDGSRTGGRRAGDATGTATQQQQQQPTGAEEPTGAPKGSGKPKEEKASKKPRGNAKGRGKR